MLPARLRWEAGTPKTQTVAQLDRRPQTIQAHEAVIWVDRLSVGLGRWDSVRAGGGIWCDWRQADAGSPTTRCS